MDAQPPQQPQPQTVPEAQRETPTVAWGAPPPPRSDDGVGFNFPDFLSFRYLITPAFVTVIYVIGVAVIVLIALGTMASGSGGGVLAGIFILLFGNLYWRIILEFIMVLFRMNDSLKSIDRRGRGM